MQQNQGLNKKTNYIVCVVYIYEVFARLKAEVVEF